MMAEPMLKVDDINVYYGAIHAVKGVSFYVNEGEIVTLIGANGAGKSTILNTVCGLLRSKTGDVSFQGKSIAHRAAHRIVSDGIAHCPEGRRVFTKLTVEENLEMGAYIRPGKELSASTAQVFSSFPVWKSAENSLPALSPAVSSRCWPLAAP